MTTYLLPPFSPVTVVQVIDVAFCNMSLSNGSLQQLLGMARAVLQTVLGTLLLILAVISTLKESIVMYKATKKWHPNHYMQLFVKDGILYFIVYVCLPSPLSFSSVHYHHILPSILLPAKTS